MALVYLDALDDAIQTEQGTVASFSTPPPEPPLTDMPVSETSVGDSGLRITNSDASGDVLVYEEKDETFGTAVYKSKSKKYMVIASYSTLTT